MAYEVIYVCNSINNKNIRRGELNILRKNEEELYFEFGELESNIKKRFYRNVETLNKDYEAVERLKNKEDKKEVEMQEEVREEVKEEVKEELRENKMKKTKKNIF